MGSYGVRFILRYKGKDSDRKIKAHGGEELWVYKFPSNSQYDKWNDGEEENHNGNRYGFVARGNV